MDTVKPNLFASHLARIAGFRLSGKLVIKSREHTTELYFDSGYLVAASTNLRKEHELLGNMLVRSEKLRSEDLEKCLDLQRQHPEEQVFLGDILVKQGVVFEHDLQTTLKLQYQEMVYRLFELQDVECEFFVQDKFKPIHFRKVEAVASQSLLMHGMRHLALLPIVRKMVPDLTLHVEVVRPLEDYLLSHKNHLVGTHERLMYSLIKPERNVQKMIDVSQLPHFTACQALTRLLQTNIIRLKSEREVVKNFQKSLARRKNHQLRAILVALLTFLITTILFYKKIITFRWLNQ